MSKELLSSGDEKYFPEILDKIKKAEVFSYDTETNADPKDGINIHKDKIIGFCLAYRYNGKIESYYLPIEHYDKVLIPQPTVYCKNKPDVPKKNQPAPIVEYRPSKNLLDAEQTIEFIRSLVGDSSLKCYIQNFKFECNMGRKYNLKFKCNIYDTMIADYVYMPDRRHGLKEQAVDHLGVSMTHTKEVMTDGRTRIAMCNAPLQEVGNYGADDAFYTLCLGEWHERRDKSDDELSVYETEMELLPVLADMEYYGTAINREHFADISVDYECEIASLKDKILGMAGKKFNLNSPAQLSEVLFKNLKLKSLKKTAIGESTSSKVLKKMVKKHPIIPEILKYRQEYKVWSTYCDKLPKKINEKTNRVHTSFNQCVTETGRLSSSDPNLQNIPRDDTRIKKGFVPQQDWLFVVSDYSQIELRVLAHLSKDPILLDAYRQGLDIHAITASKAYKVPLDKVTDIQRTKAKIINFGIIYGMTKWGLADNLGVTPDQAEEFIENYLDGYPYVRDFADRCKAYGYKNGYVKTILGRRRYIHVDDTMEIWKQMEAERKMVNTVVQGSASDLIKLAMVDIYNEFRSNNLKAKLLLQVHDELVVECPKREVKQVADIMTRCMELGQPLDIPLLAEPHIGKNWYEAKSGNKELEAKYL